MQQLLVIAVLQNAVSQRVRHPPFFALHLWKIYSGPTQLHRFPGVTLFPLTQAPSPGPACPSPHQRCFAKSAFFVSMAHPHPVKTHIRRLKSHQSKRPCPPSRHPVSFGRTNAESFTEARKPGCSAPALPLPRRDASCANADWVIRTPVSSLSTVGSFRWGIPLP